MIDQHKMTSDFCDEDEKGTLRWYSKGQWHREGGPAIIYTDGAESWYRHGEPHREDGPAYIKADGEKAWYLFGKKYDPVEWMLKVFEMSQR